jgi:hypothetical protein
VPAGEFTTSSMSPRWLPESRRRLRAMMNLPENWDSYGAVPTTPEAVRTAERLLLWLSLGDVPPPDLFPGVDGGVQLEWHIHGLDAEISVPPFGDEVPVYYHDLRTAEEWEHALSRDARELRQVRSRLLQQHGERRV